MTDRIVEIEWIDSFSIPGWNSLETIEEERHRMDCTTIGYLYEDTDEYVAVYGSRNDGGQLENLFVIPKPCVKSIKYIRKRK